MLKVFLKTNASAANDERILGIYKQGFRHNLLKQTITFLTGVTAESGVSYATNSSTTLSTANNLYNITPYENCRFAVERNTLYYIIVRTTNNNDDDIKIAIEGGVNGEDRVVNYVSTQTTIYDVYQASGTQSRIVGGSISQRTKIAAAEDRISIAESNIAQRVKYSDYGTTVTGPTGLQQDINSRVTTAAYTTKVGEIEGRITGVANRASALETRADALEGRVDAIDADIDGQVQNAIDDKVAVTVFNSLASELRNKDSTLFNSLATKVAQTVQTGVDAAQNAEIEKRVITTNYNSKMEALDNTNTAQDTAIAARTLRATYLQKIAAIEEFLYLLNEDNYIEAVNSDGTEYKYRGTFQDFKANNGI